MLKRLNSAKIDRDASQWVARMDGGPLGQDEQEQFDRWLSQDDRCEGAWVRAQAAWLMLDRSRALATPNSMDKEGPRTRSGRKPRHLSRRVLLASAASIAAGLVVYGTRRSRSVAPNPVDTPAIAISTGPTEIRNLSLADGSTTIVNADSSLEIRYSDDRRLIALQRGEGWFDVAKNPRRPFIVRAGEIQACATGTAFAVSRYGGGTTVTVTEGEVEVTWPQGGVKVAQGGQVAVAPNMSVEVMSLAASEVERELAWRERRLAFDGETLAVAADEFNRFNDTKLQIGSPNLRGQRVVGSFDLYRPGDFAEASAAIFHARVLRLPDKIVLLDLR